MSDFLASLRSAAASYKAEADRTREMRQTSDNIRQSSEYRDAAAARFADTAPTLSYSDPAIDAVRRGRATSLLFSDLSEDRTGIDYARDTALDITSGAVGGVLNLAALGLSGMNSVNRLTNSQAYDLGVPVARFAERTTQFLSGLKSREAQNAAQAYATASAVQQSENRAREQAAVAAGGNRFIEGGNRIVRDVVDTGRTVIESPQALSSGVAQGAGSMLIGGPISRGARSVVNAGAAALTQRGLMNPRMAAVLAESMEKYAMTATIGAMEGGGAFTQAANHVLEMKHEDLLANSPLYAQLIADKVSQEDAKNQVASQAGTIAATIQAPLAAATGATVARFEANPFAGQTFRGALQNIGKETLEEGFQSFSGGLSSNVGIRVAADRTFDLGDSLGSGLAEGAIFGAGTAGVFAGPGIAAGAVERVPAAARQTVANITERGRQINEANRIKPQAAAEAVRAAAQPIAPEAAMDPEIAANLPVLSSLAQQFHFDPTTYQAQSPGEANLLSRLNPEEQHDIWNVIDLGSKMISDPDVSAQDKTDLAVMIYTLYNGVTDESVNQLAELQGKAIPGGTMATELSRIVTAQEALRDNPLILKALQAGLEATPEVTLEQVQNIETPEAQQAAVKVAAQAQIAPENVNPEVAEAVVEQAEAGKVSLAPFQLNHLRSSTALTQTVRSMRDEAARMGAEVPSLVEVANQAQMYNDKEQGFAGPSVRGHYAAVTDFMAQKAVPEATLALTNFQNFAQSMANKLAAINASHLSRKDRVNQPQTFDAYSQTNGWHKGRVEVRSQVPNSVAFAQQAGVDATFVVDAYNRLTEQFPELGLKPVEREDLNADLRAGNARFVAEQTLKVRDVAARRETAPKKEAVEKPAPKQEPAPVVLEETVTEPVTPSTETIVEPVAEEQPAPTPEPTPEVVEAVAEPEAKPEVQATETITEETKKAPAIEEAFPNVIRDTNGQQLLIEGFTLNNADRSRLVGENAISVEQISNALQSPEAFQQLTGMARYKINEGVSAAYNSAFEAVRTKVFSTMQKHMEESKHFKPYLNGADPTNAIRRVNLRLLNLMERQPDGNLRFNEQVQNAAWLAMVDWLAQNSISGPIRSDEDIARKLGVTVADITPELRLAYNSGVSSQQAHDALASTLTQFLGLKAKRSVKNGLSDGLMLSLAHELLVSAQEAGLVDATAPMRVGDRYVAFMKTNKEGLGDVSFAGQTTLISQIVLQDPSIAGYTMTPEGPSGNPLRSLQGGGAPTTAAQNLAAKNENAVPQTVNVPILNIYRHLRIEGIIALFGNGQLDETLNKNDREAKEGQNLSFVSAFDTVMGLIQEMEAAAQDQGKELEEIKLFREYDFSPVNRMQQQGQFGDQSSKLVRELITPHAVVLDMTKPENMTMWRRALAQAFGVKIEKLRPEKWEAALNAILDTSAIRSAVEILADPTATPPDQLVSVLQDALDPTGKKGVSVVQLHALQSYADFVNSDDPSAFFTHMYVEADGVTDGPTNSLIYMRTGGFDAEMVQGLARGGLLFTEEATPLHAIFDPEDGNVLKDTYEIGGERLAALLPKHINTAIESTSSPAQREAVSNQSEALIRAMRILLGGEGFSYTEDEAGNRTYTIGRKQLKNPLTVTVYGSSPTGIAAKIANEMVRLVYSEISSANAKAKELGGKWQDYMFNSPAERDEFFGSLAQLGRHETRVINNKITGTPEYQVNQNNRLDVINVDSAIDFTVTPAAINNLTQAVQAFYVTPMVQAINQGMGSSVNGSGLIQRATNFLSILAKNAFNSAIQAELKKQVAAGGSLADGLSPDDLKKVLDRVAFLFPYMEDSSITVNVKGLSKGLMDDKPDSATESAVRPAAGFKDGSHVKLTIPMPTPAGVSGAAYVNISYGDGRMIIKASPNLVGGRLMVFDGINLALDKAAQNGEAINASVLESIQSGTPFDDLNRTFSNAAQTLGLDTFSAAEQAQIVKDLTPASFNQKVNATEFIKSMMFEIQSDLNNAVLDEQARQNVLKRVHMSSDHMAALATPASTAQDTSRENLGMLTTEEQAHRLEAMFREERAKLTEAAERPAPKEDLSSLVQALDKDKTGAAVTNTNRLRDMVSALNVPASQKALMRRALDSMVGTTWKVVLGTQKTVNAYAKAEKLPHVFGKGDYGLMDMARKTLFITNTSSETLAHELIHAATIDKVIDYYWEPAVLDKNSFDAITRLNLLMHEWVGTVQDVAAIRDAKTREAVSNALSVVSRLLEANRNAEALNEFMAWNLSNQFLEKLNSSIQIENKLARIARDVIDMFKKLFGFPGRDMASNIRFNTMILMRDGMQTPASRAGDMLLQQSTRDRPDLREITARFTQMLKTADAGFENAKGAKPSELALQSGYQLAQLVSSNGFPLTAQERSAFARIVAAYRANTVRDPKLNTQMDVFMGEVQKQLNQSLMMDDPNSQDPNELNRAVSRINLLNGSLDVGKDAAGRSLLVPMFVALGATSSVAQGLFDRIEMGNRKAATPGTTLDSWLRAHASNAVDALMDHAYGIRPNQKVGEQVRDIIASIVAEQDALKGQLTQGLEAPTNLVRELNEKTTNVIGKGIDLATEGLDYLTAQVKGTPAEAYAKAANGVVQTALNIFHKDKADQATSNIYSKINESEMPQELRALFTELLGVTQDNVDVLQLVKLARSAIHRVRQTYRKLLPQRISDQFSKAPTQEQWEHIHQGLGQTDLAILLDHGLSSGAVIDLLTNPNEAKRLLDQKEGEIKLLFKNSADILTGASDLADLMLTGVPNHGFVRRNALAIANQAGLGLVGSYAQDSAEVRAVDAYVSLLALNRLGADTASSLSGLASRDRQAMAYTLSQIAQARRSEMSRVSDQLRFNVPKGYMPYESVGNMVAVPMSQLNDYTVKGYKVVGTRQRGAAEALYDARAGDRIYVSTNVPTPAFKQGIFQTVRSTVFGLDAVTGLSHDNPTGGMITDPIVVKRLTAALQNGRQKENLAPLFNEQGQVYAYERLVNRAEVDSTIETQRNAAVAAGRWIGRQFEETQSAALNDVLVQKLADRWDAAGPRGTQDEFVDLFELAKTDPVVADAVKLINLKDRNTIIDKMNGKFMVERSLYEQVLGYRSMSIGDLWTGNTRLGQEYREGLANFLTGLLGPEAYRRLTVAEHGWSNLMSDARVAIVVKSMLVPAINGITNFYQLMSNGIGPVDIAKKSVEKLRETHLYAQNHLKYQSLEADLSAALGEKRPDRVRQIETEMRKIEDLNKRLSIYPLIKAGEFGQVTEGLTQDDMELTKGRIWDYVAKQADKLPPAIKTAGRYAIVAKDTALFKGLARTVSYTDFVAKAVLYDHLTNRQKINAKEAMIRVTNEFVNYDLLSGRMRSKAEEVGLMWFWAFKLRSIKVAVSMARNNPLHALLAGSAPGAHDFGTVFDDNALTLFTNGRWDNSLGPDNALRALSLNPISQVF